jgi:hypothetical protein
MAIGGARGVLVCRVWHVCGGRIGGAHGRGGGAEVAREGAWVSCVTCGHVCGTCERVCVRDVVSLCEQAYRMSQSV